MFSAKKLVKAASMGRKKTPSSTSLAAEKGHFVIYTVDRARFMMPLSYLQHEVFQELLRMSGEEFGISSERPITVPCDAACLEYVVSLVKGGVDGNLDIKSVLDSIAASACSDDFASSTEATTCTNFCASCRVIS